MNIRISKALAVPVIVIVILVGLVSWAIADLVEFAPHSDVGSTWKNITVGVSSKEQVHNELGQPDGGGVLTEYYYYRTSDGIQDDSPPYLTIDYTLLGTAKSIHVDYIRWESIDLSEALEEYGDPDFVARNVNLEFVFIYLEEGIVLRVYEDRDRKPGSVMDAYYFLPCSLECVRQKPFMGGPLTSMPEPYQP